MISLFFKGQKPYHTTQGFHSKHQALDIIGAYGVPLCAPENCLVLGIRGDTFTPGDNTNTIRGYGVRLKGLESGLEYLYWHCLPYFPVWGGDTVKRGGIVGFMGNSGYVTFGGKEVPIDERYSTAKPGMHLHIEAYKDKKAIDISKEINWDWNPTYTTMDWLKAWWVALSKMIKVVK